jgi:hypothetical protein
MKLRGDECCAHSSKWSEMFHIKAKKRGYRAYSDQNSGVPTPSSGPKSAENDCHRMTCSVREPQCFTWHAPPLLVATSSTHQVASDVFHGMVKSNTASNNSGVSDNIETEELRAIAPCHGSQAGVGQRGNVHWFAQVVRLDYRMISEVLGLQKDAAAGCGVQKHWHDAE